MLMATTATVQGREIVEYKGLVFGEVVSGVNIFKDMFSGIRDVIGGRSGAYEGEIEEARDKALNEMAKRAEKMGANAIIGIDVDYEVLGKENGMLMVSVSGTAVVVR
ncbi:MAG: heavy metal-binding domain-containing protein [Phascolarctobacterium sp.]|nr:heavy metal-binding domain-containing protein [Phascolarctobacterium sp.]